MSERKQPLLVVEDSDEDFDAIKRVINRSGVAEAIRATTGDQGLEMLRSADPSGRAVMVLLDLNTPGSDGREVLREIKADGELAVTPVVVFTTSSNLVDVEACYRNGANSYHLKPLDLRDFEATVLDIMTYWLNQAIVYTIAKGAS
jgi:CheY-like chemotaxis protein